MQFKVSGMFSDNAVLQRERPVKIWGSSSLPEGSTITAGFGNYSAEGKTCPDGTWHIYLPEMAADTTPKSLKITDGQEEIVFENVLVGDVFFVNGQSNMEFKLDDDFFFEKEKEKISPSDNIRFFFQLGEDIRPLDPETLLNPQNEPLKSHYKWYAPEAESEYTRNFSAIAYYCAKRICDKLQGRVPIGLIKTSMGGAQMTHLVPDYINQKYNIKNAENLTNYNVYNVLMHPAENYTTCGMLWYQGESECACPPSFLKYKERFFDYLNYHKDKSASGGDYTVYTFQLCSHSSNPTVNTAVWKIAAFRSFQLDVANSSDAPCKIFVIPTHDHGIKNGDTDTAHPLYKRAVGYRAGDLLLETRYNLIPEGFAQAPEPCSFQYDDTGVTIKFKNIAGSLKVQGDTLNGFETVSQNEATPAKAEIISADSIRVHGKRPDGVRYAFYQAVSPSLATLTNGSNIPCPTFADNCMMTPQLSFGLMDERPSDGNVREIDLQLPDNV